MSDYQLTTNGHSRPFYRPCSTLEGILQYTALILGQQGERLDNIRETSRHKINNIERTPMKDLEQNILELTSNGVSIKNAVKILTDTINKEGNGVVQGSDHKGRLESINRIAMASLANYKVLHKNFPYISLDEFIENKDNLDTLQKNINHLIRLSNQ